MEIEYLQLLRDNPSRGGFTCRGIAEEEISFLEQLFNSGNEFPKALRELLFLCGSFSTFLNYGDSDSQQEFQEEQRTLMEEEGINFSRRFYTINAQPSCGDPTFVYLDEGDDPMVYQLLSFEGEFEIRSLDRTLSGYVNISVQHIIDGWGI